MLYNWQHENWPNFIYDEGQIPLFSLGKRLGSLVGKFNALNETSEKQTTTDLLILEALRTSEIEGEFLSREDVMSCIKKNLGIAEKNDPLVRDKRAKGISKTLIEARSSYSNKLSKSMLFKWHKLLMEGNHYIKPGAWRSSQEPMQIISGAVGKEKVHFEAPPSHSVNDEMKAYINWFNESETNIQNPVVRAGIAHLYFESIHPFEDGNGRIGRILSEKALMQSIGFPIPISLSVSIEATRKKYYKELKRAQTSLEINNWLTYFLKIVERAIQHTEQVIDLTLFKTTLFDEFKERLNHRQKKVLVKLFNAEPSGFEGGLTAKKYGSITKASKATATRDLQQLKEWKILRSIGSGRSVSYHLNFKK